jgi:hypothetical protein
MADPPWLPGCIDNVNKLPGGKLCSVQHCEDSATYWHAVCNCQPPFQNGCTGTPPPPGCCSYTATSPIYVIGPDPCYCCCGCFANDTLVAVDATERKEIKEFVVGDLVYVAMDPDLSTWDQLPVVFSSGTGPESTGDMIQVRFGDPEAPEKIVSNRAQLFLVKGNKLKRASKLVPKHDWLARPDGSFAEVLDLTTGKFKGGLHQISTSETLTTKWEGHLLNANGVVCGDYSLQITDLETAAPEMLVEGHADLPEFGTREYAEMHAHLFADTLKAHPAGADYSDDHAANFRPLADLPRPKPPQDGTAFVTDEQAQDILRNAPRQPPHSGAGRDILNYLFKIYRGFYPTITFYLDDANELPNAHSSREYGTDFVVVNGGLIRTNAIQYESLAMVIAHQIGVLMGGDPKDEQGFTCRGQADYGTILAVFPYVWFGIYSFPMVKPAIDQVTNFFSFIDPDHRGGVPGNTCNDISIDCRLETLAAASLLKPLPHCAGGPLTPTLAVTGAVAAEDGLAVTVSFNEAVDVEMAESVGAYAFAPLVAATKATVAADALSATVEAAFDPDTNYMVTVQDVTSAEGDPLIPDKSSATFKTPPPVGTTH